MRVWNIQSNNNNQTSFQRVRILNGGRNYIETLAARDKVALFKSAHEMKDFKHTDLLVSAKGLSISLKNTDGTYPEYTALRGSFLPSQAIIDTDTEVTIGLDSYKSSYNLPMIFSNTDDANYMRQTLPEMSFVKRVIAVVKHFEEQFSK